MRGFISTNPHSLSIFEDFFLITVLELCLYVTYVQVLHIEQKRASYSLEMTLQTLVNHPVWVLGTSYQFSRRLVSGYWTGFFFSFCSSGWPQNHTDPLCLLSAGHVTPPPPRVVLVFFLFN